MLGWLHLFKDSLYFLIGTEEVCGSIGIHISFPGRTFLSPYIIGFHNLQIRVAQQRKGETMFLDEFLVASNPIYTDAEKFHVRLQFTPGIAQVTGLDCAPRRIVLGVKI